MRRGAALLIATATACSACSDRAAIETCTDPLGGVWHADVSPGAISAATATATGLARGEPDRAPGRWMLIDNGPTLEGYPLFDDVPPHPPDREIAPRTIDLRRTKNVASLRGELRRRTMHGRDSCDGHGAVLVARCNADTLELEVVDAPSPLTFTPCAWPPPARSHRETWTRE